MRERKVDSSSVSEPSEVGESKALILDEEEQEKVIEEFEESVARNRKSWMWKICGLGILLVFMHASHLWLNVELDFTPSIVALFASYLLTILEAIEFSILISA